MTSHGAVTLYRINPAYVQFGRPGCVTVEEETPLAFVYHCELQQLEPQRKYLRIISDQLSHQGWVSHLVQL